MRKIALFFLIVCCHFAFSQSKINFGLKKQLDSIMILETYRHNLHPLVDPLNKDTTVKGMSVADRADYARYWKRQDKIDSMNVVFVDSIFKKYGYPGKTLVGPGTVETAWIIMLHAKEVDKYLPIFKKAAETNELPFRYYAMSLDRTFVKQGKEQMYGTQGVCRKLNGGTDNVCFIWPVKDAATVNERRKQAGFESTVEENAKVMGIKYKVLKIEEVK